MNVRTAEQHEKYKKYKATDAHSISAPSPSLPSAEPVNSTTDTTATSILNQQQSQREQPAIIDVYTNTNIAELSIPSTGTNSSLSSASESSSVAAADIPSLPQQSLPTMAHQAESKTQEKPSTGFSFFGLLDTLITNISTAVETGNIAKNHLDILTKSTVGLQHCIFELLPHRMGQVFISSYNLFTVSNHSIPARILEQDSFFKLSSFVNLYNLTTAKPLQRNSLRNNVANLKNHVNDLIETIKNIAQHLGALCFLADIYTKENNIGKKTFTTAISALPNGLDVILQHLTANAKDFGIRLKQVKEYLENIQSDTLKDDKEILKKMGKLLPGLLDNYLLLISTIDSGVALKDTAIVYFKATPRIDAVFHFMKNPVAYRSTYVSTQDIAHPLISPIVSWKNVPLIGAHIGKFLDTHTVIHGGLYLLPAIIPIAVHIHRSGGPQKMFNAIKDQMQILVDLKSQVSPDALLMAIKNIKFGGGPWPEDSFALRYEIYRAINAALSTRETTRTLSNIIYNLAIMSAKGSAKLTARKSSSLYLWILPLVASLTSLWPAPTPDEQGKVIPFDWKINTVLLSMSYGALLTFAASELIALTAGAAASVRVDQHFRQAGKEPENYAAIILSAIKEVVKNILLNPEEMNKTTENQALHVALDTFISLIATQLKNEIDSQMQTHLGMSEFCNDRLQPPGRATRVTATVVGFFAAPAVKLYRSYSASDKDKNSIVVKKIR